MKKAVRCLRGVLIAGLLVVFLVITLPFGILLASIYVIHTIQRLPGLLRATRAHNSVFAGELLLFYVLSILIPLQVVLSVVQLTKFTIKTPLVWGGLFVFLSIYLIGLIFRKSWRSAFKNTLLLLKNWFPEILQPFFGELLNFVGALFEERFKSRSRCIGVIGSWILLGIIIYSIYSAAEKFGIFGPIAQGSIGSLELALIIVLSVFSLQLAVWLFIRTIKIIMLPRFRLVEISNDVPSSQDEYQLKIAHLSDLHLSESPRLTEGNVEWRQSLFQDCISALLSDRPNVVVITGDVTDTGHPQAWAQFIQAAKDTQIPFIVAPGNHDLNIVGYGVASVLIVGDGMAWPGLWMRLSEYFKAVDSLFGNLVFVVDAQEELRDFKTCWSGILDDNTLTDKERCQKAACLFPLMVGFENVDGFPKKSPIQSVRFVVWNTVRPSPFAFANSLGRVDDGQISRFKALCRLDGLNKKHLIHLMHHKIALPNARLTWAAGPKAICGCLLHPVVWLRRKLQMAGMVLTNAGEFVDELRQATIGNLILHGHHHSRFSGVLQVEGSSVAIVLSASSSTLGAESWAPDSGGSERSFNMLTLSFNTDGISLVSQVRKKC